jgi:tRNA-modifying protein YgfZ
MSSDRKRNPHAEYESARSACALFELSERTHMELTGRDRGKFLHNFCTNDIRALPPGEGCEAFVTSVQGKVLAHIFVFAGDQSLWLECVPGCAERLISHLSRYNISEDVEFHDRTAECGTLLAAGPAAADVLFRCGLAVAELEPLHHRQVEIAGVPVQIRRNDLLRLQGYVLVCPQEQLHQVREALQASGAQPADMDVFHALRIEAGMPWYGMDISDENLAQEVNRTSEAISFSKGCYLGQEPIARIDAMGHVNLQLRIVRLTRLPVPEAGAEIVTPGPEEKKIGRITSAALSFADDTPVALGYLRRHYDTPGLQVAVVHGDERIPAVVQRPED